MSAKKTNPDYDPVICKQAYHLRALLKEFGLTLVGFDPGITASVDARPELRWSAWHGPIKLDDNEWTWLEPLLIELRDFRKGKACRSPKAGRKPRP